ncbi:hypothetical protein FJZ26_05455, partial [Candidatus Parvarchaeota archaeon]|nr:hypothetical protein [Candidatus Parvarchaeota archaeon]
MAIQAVAYDLDGVIYRGKVPILGVVESIRELQQAGIMTFFMTNNSSKDRSDYQRALGEIGINADQACIYTSGVALAAYCKSKGYRKAFVIGESGLFKVLEAQGIEATSEKPQGGWRGAFDCVAVGLDRKFTYQKLDFALQAINGGAKFLAANTDTCLAREEDVAPGTGCLVEALSCACGKKPDFIAGKPHTYMINELLDDFKLDKSQLVFVGD